METEESEGMVLLSGFASDGPDGHLRRVNPGEGLVGQCALEKRRMLINDLPDGTVPIRSGLFEAKPRSVIVLPVLFEDRVKAVIELASLNFFTASHLAFLEQLTSSIGIVLNSIEATMQTEALLKQSQQLAAKQVEFARTIHGAGTDLLNLISDILDLSKIESGTVSVEAEEVFFGSLLEMVARPFRHEADNRKLAFEVLTEPSIGRSLVTDSK